MRTSSLTTDARNLPRLVNVDLATAIDWVGGMPADVDRILISEFARVAVSIEIYADGDHLAAEMMPGIWELDATATPWRMAVPQEPSGRGHLIVPVHRQVVRVVDFDGRDKRWRLPIGDHHLAVIEAWLVRHRRAIADLASTLGGPVIVRAHLLEGRDLLAQNLRRVGPVPSITRGASPHLPSVPVIDRLELPLPRCSEVVLEVALTRERHEELALFLAALVRAGVQRVYLRSGLLSHLAIMAREAGLQTMRVDLQGAS